MIKVVDVVAEILSADEVASEAIGVGILNLSAYAEKIKSQIENISQKPVQKGTIVVALSRITKRPEFLKTPLKPIIKLTDLAIRSSLCAVIFEKTADIQRKIAVLHPFQISQHDLFMIIEGPTEVALIISAKTKEKILKEFRVSPKSEQSDLVAITVQYSPKLAETPNVQFALLSNLAAKRVEIVELVSTFTEVTFIVKKKFLEDAVQALNIFFSKS